MTRKPRLPSRVSLLALATVMVAGASPATAQSFQGNGTFSSGTGSVTTPDSVTTNISVTSPQAVIDWTPFADGGTSGQDIVFQAGSTFANFSSATDFAVLNRIDPGDMTRMIRMDGTITSKVDGVTGGSVYFYSPSGFVLGATSLIDVGSLVLTSRPITVDGNGNFINNGTVVFGAAPDPFGTPVNPAARIETHPLSQINALNEGSYVAMVAPRVQHHGTISVNGAAALVGAEAATITFRPSGLFDIQVDVGTDDANGVAVYGDINGPASSGIGDNHRIYLAAVPKNTALTMAIQQGADLGFDVAQSADVVGNTVVLSAGHDVFFGSPTFDPSAASGAAANINILNANFTSALLAQASGNIDLGASAGQSTHLYSTANLTSSGGYIQVESVGSDALVNIDSDLTLVNDRYGDSTGESVTAGDVSIYSQGGGTLIVGGGANISANGYGGDSFTAGVAAGNGTGGHVQVQAEAGSNLSIGSVVATVDGYGGQPGAPGVNAGNGKGGYAFIGTLGNNANLAIASNVNLSANGYGGAGDGSSNECFNCDGLGGTGTGGDIFLGTSPGTGSTAYYGDFVQLAADGEGGRSATAGSAAGSGTGGNISIFASGGSQVEGFGATFASDLTASASGRGGESLTAGIAAGLGHGGNVQISANAASTLGIIGDLEVDADGFGGFNDFGVNGGDGTGGQVFLSATGGDASISVFGTADLEADGEGSFSNSDCIGCGGSGGDGTGGQVQIFGVAGTTNNVVSFANSLDLSAEGYGGIGGTGVAGAGKGGTASVGLASGAAVSVGAGLSVEADGYGGYGYNGNNAGAGTGGTAAIYGNGGSLNVTGDTFLDAGGLGGNTGIVAGGIGGGGNGGIAEIYAPGGSIDFNGRLSLDATGEGGDSAGNAGGNALGGSARVNAAGGTIHVSGNLFLDGGAIGGDGVTGGSATGRTSTPPDEAEPIAAALYAQNNGSLDIDGVAVLSAEAVGGNGSNGNGGNAQAGEVDVVAFFGSIDVGSLSVDANAYGGNGGNGGNGGSAIGGPVDIAFGLGAAAIGGTITLGSATVTADGEGGDGGRGVDGTVGGNGGIGGDGTGGRIGFTGSAANGMLDTGGATLTSLGRGGNGGAGGNGSSGVGGNGGSGGIGTGNGIQTGTISAEMAPTTGGGAAYTTMTIDTSGFGGTGGNGGTGTSGNGLGGDGGGALGGSSLFLARGTLVTADTVTLTANATGGNGGNGSTDGDGGNARTGTVQVESKDRFNHPDQRGTLQADSIVGTAIAVAGTGAANGVSSVIGNSYFRVLNGDATIGSVSITTSGSVFDNSFVNSTVSVRDGTATIGDFSFTTTGELALDASNGSMTANSINLAAGNFIPDTFSGAQVGPGTYTAGSFSIATGGNFITDAHLVSNASLSIVAPGAIDMRNATSNDGNLTLNAGSSIVGGNLDAAGSVNASAAGNITLGTIDAGTSIGVLSNNAAITTGNLDAGTNINLDALGAIVFGDVVANSFDFDSGSTVTGGDILAGTEVKGDGGGAINLGDISVGILMAGGAADNGFAVGIASPGSITVGNVEADESIGFAAGGDFSVGTIDSGADALALVSGDMSLGAVTTANTGRTYLANFSMFLAAGGPSNFDAAAVFAATPVRTGGSILIGGPVSTGSFQAAAGTTLTTQSIIAPLGIYLDAGGNITTGALSSDDDIRASSDGSIQTGDIASTLGSAVLAANGSLATGAITAGAGVQLTSNAANIATGNISAPGDIVLDSVTGVSTGNLLSDANINIVNGGSILTGDITSTGGGIFLQSDIDIVTGAIDAAFDAEFDALGNISLTGDANAGGYLFADAGGNLAMANATAGESIDVIAGGTILGANMTAGDSVIARAAGAVALGNLSAGIVNPSSEPLDGQIVAVGSLTSVSVGNVDAANFVGLASDGALTAGTIQSGGDVMLLADGPSTIGAITSNVEGRTYIAGFDMLDVGGGFEDFDPSLVYAAASPIPTAGSITVNGSIVTGRLDAFVGGDMSLGPVIAGTINGRVGGLASIGGLWEAPQVELWSNDIAIGANGGIDAGNFGDIRLVSTNATQALIGDGLTGSGYQLSNAEFGRLNSGSLEIAARSDGSAAADMLIGDLSITGPLAGSTIDDPNGYVAFATGDPQSQQAGGVIRITGEVVATGFQDTNSLEFYTGRLELDAETGLLQITGSGTDLSGELYIEADRIHVASGTILDQLAADPHYSGYQDDLNAPATVQRPDGVVRAGSIEVLSNSPQALLIQNTGTADTPAGFLTFGDGPFQLGEVAPNSIDLIINGQLITEGGTLTGVAVRDFLIDGNNIGFFTENSTINGCLLGGGCGASEPPLPPGFTPTPGIQQEIVLLGDDPLPPPPFGNEAVIDDNDEETDDTSPIVPPQPLFDTSELGEAADSQVNPKFGTPMRSTPGIKQEGDVDDPVSGSGNPALTGDSTPTGQQEKQP